MSQDETRGLNKNLDFMRAISILFLVMNVYYFCYPYFLSMNLNISTSFRPFAPMQEKKRKSRLKDLLTSEWENSPVSRWKLSSILSTTPMFRFMERK